MPPRCSAPANRRGLVADQSAERRPTALASVPVASSSSSFERRPGPSPRAGLGHHPGGVDAFAASWAVERPASDRTAPALSTTPRPRSSRTRVRRPRRRDAQAALAELALAAVVATAFGFSRLFIGWGFVGRSPRSPSSPAPTWPSCCAAAAWSPLSAMAVLGGRRPVPSLACTGTRPPLPTGRHLDGDAPTWPTPGHLPGPHRAGPRPGFMVAAGLRCSGPGLTVGLPGLAPPSRLGPGRPLFVFAPLPGRRGLRLLSAAALGGAALAFVLRRSMLEADGTAGWLTAERRGERSLLRRRRRCGCCAAVAVARSSAPPARAPTRRAVEPARGGGVTPGHHQPAGRHPRPARRYQTHRGVHGRSRGPAYWRLTALDTFDGPIWSSTGTYSRRQGASPDTSEARRPAHQPRAALRSRRLAPSGCPPPSSRCRRQPRRRRALRRRLLDADRRQRPRRPPTARYDVVSSPRITPDDLRGHAGATPSLARFTGLPEASADADRVRAEEMGTDDDPTTRRWPCRTSSGPVHLQPRGPAGHGRARWTTSSPAGSRGYCEQFAGTFAAIARSIGLPARVAVGFTPGIRTPTNPAPTS